MIQDGAGQIVVALRAREPELRGTVQIAGAPPGQFTGWLGLLSALQSAIGEIEEPAPRPGRADEHPISGGRRSPE